MSFASSSLWQHFALHRRLAGLIPFALTMSLLLSAAPAIPQNSSKAPKPAQESKENTSQAEQAADRGDKAAASGNTKEALDDYATATRLAPGNLAIRRRAAAVRAQVVQKMVDEAEAAALDGNLEKATDRINDALHIDPGNAILAE